jgi:uncharacterized protein YndB with AHSA1/START domain
MAGDRGNLQQAGDRWELTFTRRLPHPPEKLWRALTEPADLKAWFPSTIDGDRTAGAKLQFRFDQPQVDPMDGEMLVYEPPSKLEFTWGDDTLTFTLEPDGDGTVLTLVDTIVELGKAARDAAGWHEKLDVLAAHLDGAQPPEPMERWKEVHPEYVEQFGPEAATMGPPEGVLDE